MICGLCHYEFDPAQAETACVGCPLTKNCHLICCPRCGYEMAPEAKLIALGKKLWRKRTKLKTDNSSRGSEK